MALRVGANCGPDRWLTGSPSCCQMSHTPEEGREAKPGINLHHRPADPHMTLKGFATSIKYLHKLPAVEEAVWSSSSHPLNTAMVQPVQVGWSLTYPTPDTAGHRAWPWPSQLQASIRVESNRYPQMGQDRGRQEGTRVLTGRWTAGSQEPVRDRWAHIPLSHHTLYTKHTLKDKMTKNLKAAIPE